MPVSVVGGTIAGPFTASTNTAGGDPHGDNHRRPALGHEQLGTGTRQLRSSVLGPVTVSSNRSHEHADRLRQHRPRPAGVRLEQAGALERGMANHVRGPASGQCTKLT